MNKLWIYGKILILSSQRFDKALGSQSPTFHTSRRQTPLLLAALRQCIACSQEGALSPGLIRAPNNEYLELLEVCSRNQGMESAMWYGDSGLRLWAGNRSGECSSRQTVGTLSHTYGIVFFVADAAFTSDIQASGTVTILTMCVHSISESIINTLKCLI